MDMGELWEKACMLLKGEMNEISYNTWIQSSLKPLALEGDCGGNLVIKRHTEDYLPVELAPEELRDCDTPQELAALRIQAE